MIRRFGRLITIANLRVRGRRGQIATFLLLMLVVVLIFAMLIANLGQVSLQATTVSNAADSAALLLGSQLATTSNQIYTALGNQIKKCKKGGLFALILAIIVVVILTIINIYCGGCMTWAYPYVLAMIAAGAAAGAIGGAVAGTGAAQGAIQGAIVGAAIGGGAAIGFQAGLYLGAAIGAPVGSSTGALALTLGSIGAGVFTALAVGSSLYNAAVQEQDIQAAIASASKLLNRLSDRRRILEAVILSALSQTVDDPTMVTDNGDVDGDGDVDTPQLSDLDRDGQTTDQVSRFLVLWAGRLMGFDATAIPEMEQAIVRFVEGPLARFREAVERAYRVHEAGKVRGAVEAQALEEWAATNKTSAGGWSQWLPSGTPSFLGRDLIENRVQGANGQPDDVTMEELVVPLETSPRANSENDIFYEVPFWQPGRQPGPTLEQYANWGASEEETTSNPPGWDQVDGAIEELVTFVESYDPLQAIVRDRAANPAALSEQAMGWEGWVLDLYDPDLDEVPPSFDCDNPEVGCDSGVSTDYERLYLLRETLGCWRTQLTTIKGGLPGCTEGGESSFETKFVRWTGDLSTIWAMWFEGDIACQNVPYAFGVTPGGEAYEELVCWYSPGLGQSPGRLPDLQCHFRLDRWNGWNCTGACVATCSDISAEEGEEWRCFEPSGEEFNQRRTADGCDLDPRTVLPTGQPGRWGCPAWDAWAVVRCGGGGGGEGTQADNFPCTWQGAASCGGGEGGAEVRACRNPDGRTYTPDEDVDIPPGCELRSCQIEPNSSGACASPPWRFLCTIWCPPSGGGGGGGTHATVDADQCDPDEFERVIGDGQDDGQNDGQLKALIDEIDAFRAASKALYDELRAIEARLLGQGITLPEAGFIQNPDGKEGLEYWWIDTRGTHSVKVWVGPFRLPRTKKTKSGNFLFNKTCIHLVDGADSDGSRTWVKITRKDPTNAPSRSVLWPWNPSDGTITKCASARFNWESVGLARTRRCDPADRPPPPDACSLE